MGVNSTADDTLSWKFAAAARSARVGRRGRKQGQARSAGGRPTQDAHLDPLGRRQPGGSSLGPLKGACQAPGLAANSWGMPGVPTTVGSRSTEFGMCTNFDFPLPVLTEFTAFTSR